VFDPLQEEWFQKYEERLMDRDRLRPPYMRMPKWVLIVGFYTLGLVAHLGLGLWTGLWMGWIAWDEERRMLHDEVGSQEE
jgi:hypothetical protein